MNNNAICAAIVTRLQADQGSGALFATGGGAGLITGVYRNEAPSTATFPYIVFSVTTEADRNTFRGDIFEVSIDFGIYVPVSAPPSVVDTIVDRLYGDATVQTSGEPTFGLHRHPLTLSTGTWSGGTLEMKGTQDASDRDYYIEIDTYKFIQSRTSP